MQKTARQSKIKSFLESNPKMTAKEISRRLDVHESTIKRDLNELGIHRQKRLTKEESDNIKSRLLNGEWVAILARETGLSREYLYDLRKMAEREAAC